MADFCTIAQVEKFLNVKIEGEDDSASCAQAISWATEGVRNYCRQTLSLVEDDEVTLDVEAGRRKILLPELPVIRIASVEEDGALLTVASDYQLGQHGILYRLGRAWLPGVQAVTVTYTHGYAVMPADIEEVAVRAASRIYQAGLRSKEQDGVLGVQSLSLGDYSVSYGSEHGGGSGEGVMGVSAARWLLMSEKDMLNRYRV